MRKPTLRLLAPLVVVLAALAVLVAASTGPASTSQASQSAKKADNDSVIFFAADGLRQDLVESWAGKTGRARRACRRSTTC